MTAGVVLHLPMYFDASDMHYRLNGMAMDAGMYAGMALILIGLALAAYGLIPRRSAADEEVSRLRVKSLDDARIRPAHVALLVVMAVAVRILGPRTNNLRLDTI